MSASRTAEYVALYRALETAETRREPLFRDPFAVAFLPPALVLAVRAASIGLVRTAFERYADLRAPGARTSAIGRTRFIDDAVRGGVERGARQLVILGAGYDARAHRLPELREVRVFEVDQPDTQREKRARLAAWRAETRRDVDYVAVDFTRDDLGTSLAAAGWDRGAPSIFIWEGVTNYLTEAAVAAVLGFVGASAPGGLLVFTYVHRGVIDGSRSFPGAARIRQSVGRMGEPWIFGLDPAGLAAFLSGFGLALEDDLGADQYRRRYPTMVGRGLDGYAFYRIAIARIG